jgi:hypothetical protein
VVRRDPRQWGEKHNRWTAAALLRVCDWLRLRTAAGLSQLLKRLKISYKRGREHVHSPDPDYVPKLRDVHICIQRSRLTPELEVVLFQDELTYYRRPSLAAAYELSGHTQPRAELGHRYNLAYRVAAAVDIWTGRVVYEQRSRLGVEKLVAFYHKVCQAYPQAQTIYLVQDNWPVHDHPDVRAALQPQRYHWPVHVPAHWPTQPRAHAKRLNLPLQLVKLPTYASWTNPAEKLWRKLKQEELHLHRFADDWEGLKQRVASFLDQFAQGSRALLRYIGLSEPEKLYQAVLARLDALPP